MTYSASIQDSVSQGHRSHYGLNYDYCGDKTVVEWIYQDMITSSATTFTMETSDANYGVYTIQFKASLDDYLEATDNEVSVFEFQTEVVPYCDTSVITKLTSLEVFETAPQSSTQQ